MSKVQDAAEHVADNLWWRAVERVAAILAAVVSTLAAGLLALVLYWTSEKVEQLDNLTTSVAGLHDDIFAIQAKHAVLDQKIENQGANLTAKIDATSRSLSDLYATFDQRIRARQADWNGVYSRLSAAETNLSSLIKAVDNLGTKIDRLGERIPPVGRQSMKGTEPDANSSLHPLSRDAWGAPSPGWLLPLEAGPGSRVVYGAD